MNNLLKYLILGLLSVVFLPSAQSQCTVKATASAVDVLCGDTVKLTAVGSGVLAFRNNFNCGQVQCPEGTDKSDPNQNFGQWSNSSTAQFDNPCLPNHPSGTPHIWFNNASPAPRVLATEDLPLATGGSVVFDMRFADPDLNGNASPCENPDAAGEGVHVQYSANGGPWTDIVYYSPGNGNDPVRTVWTTYTVEIPQAAWSNQTKIRWAQLENSGTLADNLDHWGLDNAEIIANPPNATYTWQHTSQTKNTGGTDPVVPTTNTTYSVTYDDGVNTCSDQVTVNVRRQTVNVNAAPPGPYCPGDDVNLVAEAEIDIPNYGCGITTECQGSTRQELFGIGTLTNGNYQALGTTNNGGGGVTINNCVNGQGNSTNWARTQFIVRASEFSNFLQGGQIYQVSLNSATAGDWPNFRISMGCTNKTAYASSAASEFVNNLPVVYTSNSQTLIDGWNEFTLDNKFEWDGQSNVIVQICWFGANSNKSGQFRKTTTPFNSVVNTYSCSVYDCNGYLGANAVVDNNRPSFKMDMCYRLDPQLTYTWSPADDLDATNQSTVTSTPTQSRTYTVTVADSKAPSQCAVTETIDVDLISLDAFTPEYEEPWCVGSDLRLISGVSGATSYAWTGPDGFTSDQENPVITAAGPGAAGDYEVTVSNGNCSGTASVTVTAFPVLSAGTGRDTVLCQSSNSFDLSLLLTGADAGGVWIEDATGDTLSGSNADLQAYDKATLPDVFAFTYAVSNECGNDQAAVQLTVNPQFLAGDDNSGNICETLGTVELNDYRLGTFDDNGRWEDPDNTGQLAGSVLTTTDLGFGEYDFWYIQESDAPCTNDTAVITLTIQNQPSAGTDGVGQVCVDETTDLTAFLGGTPDGNGIWSELTTSGGTINGSSYDATGVPTGTYRFRYDVAAVDPCVASAAFLDLTVNDIPLITNVQTNCDPSGVNFVVTFTITGGDPGSYDVDQPGTIDAQGNYTSNPIPSETNVTFTVSDDNGCGVSTITTTRKCDCTTEAAEMKTDTLVRACEGQSVKGVVLAPFVSDGDDTTLFYLHKGSGLQLVGKLDSNRTGEFNFIPATMTYGTTYYVSSAAANNNGFDYLDYSDPCFIVSQGTPVIFQRNPVTMLNVAPNPICPGEQTTLSYNTTNGTAPFTIDISGGAGVFVPSANRSDDTTVTAMDTTTYQVVTVVDANGCSGTGGSTTLNVNEAPTATLVAGQGCGIAGSNLQINVTGAGTMWTVVLTNDKTGAQETLNGITSAGYSGPPSTQDSLSAVTYSLVSVTDNSGSICPGVVSGSYIVNPPVSGEITGVDSTYCQGNSIEIRVNLTGIGPWNIVFNDGQGGTHNATANFPTDVIQLPNGLTPGSYTFTIASISDQSTGCTGSGTGSAAVTINPGPNAQIGFNLQDPLDNSPTKSTTICVDQMGAIDFQYLGGSGTLTVNWTVDGVNQTPVNVVQGTKTTVPFNPNSITGARNIVITSVTDNTAAGCSGGGDQATINVKNLPSATISLPQVVCDGDMVNFSYNTSGEGNVSFDIVDGNGNTVTTVNNPAGNGQTASFPAPAVGSYTYTVQNISDGGAVSCTGSNLNTYNLQVDPLPTINLSSNAVTICQGQTAQIPYDLGVNGNYDITVSIAQNGGSTTTQNRNVSNDGNISLAGLAPGVYTITVTNITSQNGAQCSNTGTGSTQLTVNQPTTVTSMTFSPNPVCENDQVTFSFQLNGNGPFTVTYTDNLGNSNQVSVPVSGSYTSAPFTATTGGNFSITQIVDANNPSCPWAGLPRSENLVVNPAPSLDLTAGDRVCEGEVARISYSMPVSGDFTLSYNDHLNNSYSQNVGSENGSFAFTGLGNPDSLEIRPISVTDNSTGCVGAVNNIVSIVSKPNPVVNIGYSPGLAGCAPFAATAQFTPDNNYDTRSDQWTWTSQGNTVNQATTFDVDLPNPATAQQVNLTVRTIHGCEGSAGLTFTSYSQPEASFIYGPGEPTTMQSEVSFRSTSSSDARTFQWTVDGVVEGSAFEFRKLFPGEQADYVVCLEAANNGGCVDTYCQTVSVKGVLQIFVPNTFTPDGDGINDVFMPIVNEPLEGEYTLEIYNRWGELIFESNDPDIGWDGKNQANEMSMVGMYVYKLRLISAFDNKDVYQDHGTIMLAR